MIPLFNNRHQGQGVRNVMDALQRLEEDPESLSLERTQRYNDPPPPYPLSGETTQPASPAEASVDDEAARIARRRTMLQSVPSAQFERQTSREEKRIIHQIEQRRYGRRQTLPYDHTADLLANADNNVRARWVKQGIWKEEWGTAWPKGAQASDRGWRSSHENTRGPYICTTRWGHEKRPEPGQPAPEPAPEPVPKPEAKPSGDLFVEFVRKEPNTITEESGRASAHNVAEAPATASDRDTSASRPYNQFIFQTSQEHEWLKDEIQFKHITGTIDINAMAYESTKKNWIEDEIWNSTWEELPGATWMHEDLDEEEEHQTSKPQPGPATDESVKSGPTPGVHNNGTNSNNSSTVHKEVNASRRVISRTGGKRKRTKGTSRLSAVDESRRSAEESAGRVLRSARTSKVTKPSESRSTVSNTHSQTQDHRKLRTLRGDPNIAPGNEQASAKKPIRIDGRSSLSLVRPEMLKPKSKDATLQLTSVGMLNNTGKRRPAVEHQPIAIEEPRRSERIAAQVRNTIVERKRKTAAPSIGESKGRSRSTPRAASNPADSNRIKKRQRSSNCRT